MSEETDEETTNNELVGNIVEKMKIKDKFRELAIGTVTPDEKIDIKKPCTINISVKKVVKWNLYVSCTDFKDKSGQVIPAKRLTIRENKDSENIILSNDNKLILNDKTQKNFNFKPEYSLNTNYENPVGTDFKGVVTYTIVPQ